jgi:SAM-dependent methyltransferase
MSGEFWEDVERVERFASRAPDHRLVELLESYDDPGGTRVLDLGCAGGRNTVVLAEQGFDVWALDAAAAMVERVRERLVPIVGAEASRDRVVRGRMDALPWGAGTFDLVVSLGVMHSARSRAEWDRGADETVRVLGPGGRLLFNQFMPGTDLTGEGVSAVAGEPGVYEGLPGGRAVLLEAESLDAAWAARGLAPEVPSETVRVERDGERRVSLNALYRLTARG